MFLRETGITGDITGDFLRFLGQRAALTPLPTELIHTRALPLPAPATHTQSTAHSGLWRVIRILL